MAGAVAGWGPRLAGEGEGCPSKRAAPTRLGPDPHWPSPRRLMGQIQSSPVSMRYKDSLQSFKKMQF